MNITFYGGVGEVTGSRHLLEAEGKRVLMDYGLFQGHRGDAIEKNKRVPPDVKSIDAVLLSHAHIDHSGGLPLLTKAGYAGPIRCTEATVDLCKLMLMDSAHLQVEDAKFFNKVHAKNGQRIEPLYDDQDALRCLARFQGEPYLEPRPLSEKVRFRFHNAGHVLGSAMIEVEADTAKGKRRVLFTGDLGRRRMLLMSPPETPQNIDYLLVESTYGDRVHDPITLVEGQMQRVLQRAWDEKGRVLIPSFALERTQEILFVIEKLRRHKQIPPIPVYVDSPMAVNITELFTKHIQGFSFAPEFKAYVAKEGDPFHFEGVHYVHTVDESKALNDIQEPIVILSASGMCEGGRILHHLRNNLDKPTTTVLIVGYQAQGTLGRKLSEGAKKVRIYGFDEEVKARVEQLHTFSGHADRVDLLWFIQSLQPRPRRIFLVHGDPADRVALARHLKDQGIDRVELPEFGQRFELD